MKEELHWIKILKEKNIPVILLLNKSDILHDTEREAQNIKDKSGQYPLIVSAKAHQGIAEISQAIIRHLPEDFDAQSIWGIWFRKGISFYSSCRKTYKHPKGASSFRKYRHSENCLTGNAR